MLKTRFQHPQYVLLLKNIDELYSTANDHHCWLLGALQQQEANNLEMQQMNNLVNENRTQLTQSFTLGSGDTLSLRKDLAEHSVRISILKLFTNLMLDKISGIELIIGIDDDYYYLYVKLSLTSLLFTIIPYKPF